MSVMTKSILMRFLIVLLLYPVICLGCASSAQEDLEIARFALDSGDWDTAIEHASAVLSEDSSDVDASLLLASAYAGKSGIEVVDVFSRLADYAHRKSMYRNVHDALTAHGQKTYNPIYIRRGILALTEVLRPLPGENNELFMDHLFKTSLLYMVEAFATPSMVSQPTRHGEIDTSKITDEIKDDVENDFLRADEMFLKYGFKESDDPVKQIRYTRCQLQEASGTTGGFEKPALQDMVLCQLSDDPDSLSKDNGDLKSPNITVCKDFEFEECED
jgi:hypothetical protein